MNRITKDMKYRYSLMKYVEKHGVAQASRRYNKGRSYIYCWKSRFDGSIESLVCRSRRPYGYPNQHTEAVLTLIRNMRRRNPHLGIVELWARLRNRGYTRCVESLWRVLRREGLAEKEKPRKKYKPKPYEQMQRPGQRIQIDVKVVPRRSIADPQLKLYGFFVCVTFVKFMLKDVKDEVMITNHLEMVSRIVHLLQCLHHLLYSKVGSWADNIVIGFSC